MTKRHKLLVIDDSEQVVDILTRFLSQKYDVITAYKGLDGLKIFEAHKGDIDLVITDLVMPDNMNGRELAEKLWLERPDLKVIFSSGYSADIVGKDFRLEPEVNYLQKPYEPQTLVLAVRRCLDGKRVDNGGVGLLAGHPAAKAAD